MEIKKELIKRDIAGDTVLVPVGKTVMENNGLFILNELGAFIWDMLPELGSEEDAVSAMLREYDIDEDTARSDTAEFFEKLRGFGIIGFRNPLK